MLQSGLLKLPRFIFTGYLAISMLYTGYIFIYDMVYVMFASGGPLDILCLHKPIHHITLAQKSVWNPWSQHHPLGDTSRFDLTKMHTQILTSPEDILTWKSSQAARELGIGFADSTPILEATYLSKAFAQSLHPTKIIPFYFKASATAADDDVTVTTLITSNRFKVFRQLVERYKGPISVTIHIPTPQIYSHGPEANLFSSALSDLHDLYASSPYFRTFVDVHLVLSPLGISHKTRSSSENARQFNVWRNIARLFARTEFVMMLDVDFALCTDWRKSIRDALQRTDRKEVNKSSMEENTELNTAIIHDLRAGTVALVVPAFEYAKQEDGLDLTQFPRNKQELLPLSTGLFPKIMSFHASWAPGHNATDYSRYFSIRPDSGEIYKVTQYQSSYEPYVIMSKTVPWCDERFTGYGGNKAACLFEMYLSGVSFYVLADHFLIHQSHKYEEQARREERRFNRKLYAEFKEETCLRYLHRFHAEGRLHTSVAMNAKEECKKIKNVTKIVSQVCRALGGKLYHKFDCTQLGDC